MVFCVPSLGQRSVVSLFLHSFSPFPLVFLVCNPYTVYVVLISEWFVCGTMERKSHNSHGDLDMSLRANNEDEYMVGVLLAVKSSGIVF